jgi:type IX secretion system PorP/SprF family membrane protein
MLLPLGSNAQQHFSYNQYMHNLGPINSAWYLSDPSASLNAVIRKQWVGMDGAPSTLILNGHAPLNRIRAATGINLSYDSFGPEKLFDINAFFAKSVRLSEGEYLSAFLSLGLNRYEALYKDLDDQDPAFLDDILENSGMIGFGAMFYMPEKFFAGFSAPRLSMRELGIGSERTEYSFNTPYYLTAGYLGNLSEGFKIKPVILATHTKGLQTVIDFSTTLYIADVIGLGLNYGTRRELGAQISFFASNNLRFGYSYQFGTESYGISNFDNNTHEVGLGYRFGKGLKKKLL